MANLQDVLFLETTYPCWAYALARVGKKGLLSLDWIAKKMPKILLDYEDIRDSPQIGDILIWGKPANDDSCLCYAPVKIVGNEIIWEKIRYNYHVCVYEGYNLVSDMVKTDSDFELPWIIRKRRLSDLSDPDFVIRFGE